MIFLDRWFDLYWLDSRFTKGVNFGDPAQQTFFGREEFRM